MPRPKYYFDIRTTRSRDRSGGLEGVLASMVALRAVHDANKKVLYGCDGNQSDRLDCPVALAFPLMDDGIDPMASASLIRVFADTEGRAARLAGILENPGGILIFLGMEPSEAESALRGRVSVSDVKKVPTRGISGWRAYKRLRWPDKSTPAYVDRVIRHTQKKFLERRDRGLELGPMRSHQEIFEVVNARSARVTANGVLYIRTPSSAGHRFSLFVGAETLPRGDGCADAIPSGEVGLYGLSSMENPLWLPHF